jgi:hypothetical protein
MAWQGGFDPYGAPIPPLPPLPPHLKAKNGPAILLSAIGVLIMAGLVAGAVIGIVYAIRTIDGDPGAGDCVDVYSDDLGDGPELLADKVDCAKADADYLVGVRRADPNTDCPGTDYRSFIFNSFDASRLCLIPNVADGDCFDISAANPGHFDCTDRGRSDAIRVLRVLDGIADGARCDDESARGGHALVFTVPDRTVCYEDL